MWVCMFVLLMGSGRVGGGWWGANAIVGQRIIMMMMEVGGGEGDGGGGDGMMALEVRILQMVIGRLSIGWWVFFAIDFDFGIAFEDM